MMFGLKGSISRRMGMIFERKDMTFGLKACYAELKALNSDLKLQYSDLCMRLCVCVHENLEILRGSLSPALCVFAIVQAIGLMHML